MQALEVGDLGLVAGIDEGLETGLHQLGAAAAKHGLFAEQSGIGLFLEVGLEHAGAGATDDATIGERELLGVGRWVLGQGVGGGNVRWTQGGGGKVRTTVAVIVGWVLYQAAQTMTLDGFGRYGPSPSRHGTTWSGHLQQHDEQSDGPVKPCHDDIGPHGSMFPTPGIRRNFICIPLEDVTNK